VREDANVKNPALIRPKASNPDVLEIVCWSCLKVGLKTSAIRIHPALAGRMSDAEQKSTLAYTRHVVFPHNMREHANGFFAKRRGRVRQEQIRHASQRGAVLPLERYEANGHVQYGYMNLVPLRLVRGFACPHCGASNEVVYR
jgi:hypothetical protein